MLFFVVAVVVEKCIGDCGTTTKRQNVRLGMIWWAQNESTNE
jgi:hypothetical protein